MTQRNYFIKKKILINFLDKKMLFLIFHFLSTFFENLASYLIALVSASKSQ